MCDAYLRLRTAILDIDVLEKQRSSWRASVVSDVLAACVVPVAPLATVPVTLVALATLVEPIAATMSAALATEIAPAPLPRSRPPLVKVVAPVPPLPTASVPLTWVVRPILPQDGAVATPPEMSALPAATPARRDSAYRGPRPRDRSGRAYPF